MDYEKIISTRNIVDAPYLFICCPEHKSANSEGYVRLHILVAENKIGRELKDDECVHHLDMNKHNNSPDNLIVFKTNADHGRFHHSGIKIEIEPNIYISPIQYKQCPICNKKFYRKGEKYCSKKCSQIAQQKTVRPTKEQLLECILSKSFLQIAKDFNVCDNTIRKWCKSYDLPYKQKDIKLLKNI